MNSPIRPVQVALVIASLCAGTDLHAAANAAPADETLSEVVVTAARMRDPVLVVTDPRAPRQPVPAHDGADYLKNVPGFSVIRKGGTDGDPVFRGMSASRVSLQIDGEQVLGGCGMRMNPPTAYVYPESFDRIVIVKGPQTVLRGAGNSAAAVSFERAPSRFDALDLSGHASVLGGSDARRDFVADLRGGGPGMGAQLALTRADGGDYTDGAGRDVHGAYSRWSAAGVLAGQPDRVTDVALSGTRSDGEASYADRAMDGVKFARSNVGLKAERRELTPHLSRLAAQAFYNYVDHVMDNYSRRTFVPSGMIPSQMVSNPDRRTTGGKLELGLDYARVQGTVGYERQDNRHTLRGSMNQAVMPYEQQARVEDARFSTDSLYGEAMLHVSTRTRLVAGLRLDDWHAVDSRSTLAIGMGRQPNPTAQARRNSLLGGGFARVETDAAARPATLFLGVGHVERFPDYWELISAGKESASTISAFGTRAERTTQLDTGIVWKSRDLEFSLSAYAADVADFILVQNNVAKGMRRTTIVRNIDARTWGGEADASLRLGRGWRFTGTLAYARGDNLSDDTPLAQMPPLEARLSAERNFGKVSVGGLVRWVDAQDRYVIDQGNIVGQDIGATAGFVTLALNGSWRPAKGWHISAGIDNLLDKAYAEHLSRAGAMVSGFAQTVRVSEPGRTAWLRASADF